MTKRDKRRDAMWNNYMALPYSLELIPDGDGWFVSIPDLPGCISQGDTPEEALEMIRDAQRMWLQTAIEDGEQIPRPSNNLSNTKMR